MTGVAGFDILIHFVIQLQIVFDRCGRRASAGGWDRELAIVIGHVEQVVGLRRTHFAARQSLGRATFATAGFSTAGFTAGLTASTFLPTFTAAPFMARFTTSATPSAATASATRLTIAGRLALLDGLRRSGGRKDIVEIVQFTEYVVEFR
jgi:hypothetical protein